MESPLFTPDFTRAALMMLMEYALKGVFILLIIRLVMAVWRGTPAMRHAVWAVALAVVLVAPAVRWMAPASYLAVWDMEAISGPINDLDILTVPADAQLAQVGDGRSFFVLNREGEARAALDADVLALMGKEVAADAQIVRTPGSAYLVQPKPAAAPAPLLGSLITLATTASWTDLILVVWFAGIAVLVGWMVAGITGLFWLKLRSMPLQGAEWDDLVEELSDRYGLRRPVTLLTNTRVAMPMTWGLWRPVVMLPLDAEAWPEERRRSVLLHEMAHIARWDYLTQTFAFLVCAVNWFNPLVWMAAGQLRLEQEKACDDRVLGHGMKASTYASQLLELARSVRSTFVSPSAAMSMARPSQLEGRVVSILDESRQVEKPSWQRIALSGLFAGVVILPLAAAQVWRPVEFEMPVPISFRGSVAAVAPVAPVAPVKPVAPVAAIAPVAPVASEMPSPTSWSNFLAVWSDPDTTDDDRKVARQKAIKALRAALKDENEEIRHDALAALARIGGVEVVDALVDVLQNDPSVDVRYQAVVALSRMNSEEAVPAFLEALGDEHEMIRQVAVQALGRQSDDRVIDALARVLQNDTSRDVRIAAANALGTLRDIRAVDALTEAMEDDDVEIRRVAARALSQLNYGEEERVVSYNGGWNVISPDAISPAEFPVIVRGNALRADRFRTLADSSRLYEFQSRSQALQNQLNELAQRNQAETEILVQRQALRQRELESLSGQAIEMEARISALIRTIEEQPETDACREAIEKLEALKDVSPRARIALENLQCEKE